MNTPIETVKAFCEAFPDNNGITAIRQWFTPQTIWVNEGVALPIG
jgi:limonene-1,2-epoxide hydrolase